MTGWEENRAQFGGHWEENFINSDYRQSVIEDAIIYDEEVIKKIFAIERVFDRMKKGSIRKELIRQRYLLPDNSIKDIQTKLGISERTYFRIHNSALISFARALGHII